MSTVVIQTCQLSNNNYLNLILAVRAITTGDISSYDYNYFGNVMIITLSLLGHEKLIICFWFPSWSFFFAERIAQSPYNT